MPKNDKYVGSLTLHPSNIKVDVSDLTYDGDFLAINVEIRDYDDVFLFELSIFFDAKEESLEMLRKLREGINSAIDIITDRLKRKYIEEKIEELMEKKGGILEKKGGD